MAIQHLLRVLVARWWLAALVLGSIVGGTALVTALIPKAYTAKADIVIEPKSVDAFGGMSGMGMMAAQTYVATQIDILTSTRIARDVVTRLRLAESPFAQQQWREETQGQGSVEDFLAERLSKNLDVKPSRESSVVSVSFTGADPEFSAAVANAFGDAYIASTTTLRNAPNKVYADWFEEQLKTLRTNLETAQSRLSAYQQRNGIVASDERIDVENNRLAELSQQLSLAQSTAVDTRSRARRAKANVTSVPEVAQTPVVQGLRTDIGRAEASLAQLSKRLGEAHPTLQIQQAELEALKERLERELRNAQGTVEAVSSVNVNREQGLREAVSEQKQRVLHIRKQRDEMSTLIREAENAQKIYDAALQRFAQTRLESQNTQSGAYVLTTATAPARPSNPKVLRNMAISVVLGCVLGTVAVLVAEFLSPRVRTSEVFERGLNVPVLASLPRVRSLELSMGQGRRWLGSRRGVRGLPGLSGA